jgi:hypothetical protein
LKQQQKIHIMKTVFKSKIILVVLFTGVLFFSCKNNQDGYSDEIDTTTPTDSTTTTTAGHGQNIGTESADSAIDSTASGSKTTGSGSTAGATEGQGSGPGESAKDGSTYTSSSGTQKDSLSGKKTPQKSKTVK